MKNKKYATREDHIAVAKHLWEARRHIAAAIGVFEGKTPVRLIDALLRFHNENYYRVIGVLESERIQRCPIEWWDYYRDPNEAGPR